ncbi:MAG TPA: hypothetical protein VJQ78_06185 [Sphingobium sp.]|nr:hypothetical protein [Sphingobium sp.]
MTVPVHFPDGTIRQVPGHLRRLSPSQDRAPATFQQVPLACDPLWRYERVADRWVATRRALVVTALSRPAETWWAAIACMTDDPPDPSPAADEPMRPAA